MGSTIFWKRLQREPIQILKDVQADMSEMTAQGVFSLFYRRVSQSHSSPRAVEGILDEGSDRGVWKISLHPTPCRIKNAPLSHKIYAKSIQDPSF